MLLFENRHEDLSLTALRPPEGYISATEGVVKILSSTPNCKIKGDQWDCQISHRAYNSTVHNLSVHSPYSSFYKNTSHSWDHYIPKCMRKSKFATTLNCGCSFPHRSQRKNGLQEIYLMHLDSRGPKRSQLGKQSSHLLDLELCTMERMGKSQFQPLQ